MAPTSEDQREVRASFGDGRGVAGLECFYFFKKGHCKWGKECKYSHIPTGHEAEEPRKDEFGSTAGTNARKSERTYTKWQGQVSPTVYHRSRRSTELFPGTNSLDARGGNSLLAGPAPSIADQNKGFAIRGRGNYEEDTRDPTGAFETPPRGKRMLEYDPRSPTAEIRRSRSPLPPRLPLRRRDPPPYSAHDPGLSIQSLPARPLRDSRVDFLSLVPTTTSHGRLPMPVTESFELPSSRTSLLDPPPSYQLVSGADARSHSSRGQFNSYTGPSATISEETLDSARQTRQQIEHAIGWIQGLIGAVHNLPILAARAEGPAAITEPGFHERLTSQSNSAATALQPIAATVSSWKAEVDRQMEREMRRRDGRGVVTTQAQEPRQMNVRVLKKNDYDMEEDKAFM